MSTSELPQIPEGLAWPVILGIDPGTRLMGYGAIIHHSDGPRMLAAGAIRGGPSKDVPTRLGEIRRELDVLLSRLRPSVVVVEHAFTAINMQSALRVGEGRGVALSAAVVHGAEVVQYQASEAKKSVVGDGQAKKERVAAMVAAELGLEVVPEPIDATDALALALTYVHRQRFVNRLG
ncbi:crossover junction endodeoxyribonuclease RuvC [Planctomycetota bacterium]|jgi:crossover junction endodeoxyribonuclease RuvC|nr:crossover junction endodeoxyribonuclease RuvC [Planctomycetota bacterium]